MELRQLEAFVAVAEESNFTRAAGRLHLAQSGLSATIRSLEKELKAPLFMRSTRRVELTPAGTALLSEARRTLASARAATDAVAAVEGLTRGNLTLGVTQAGWLYDLAGLLARYRAAYPGIELKLQHASSAELARLVLDGIVDMTFATALDAPTRGVISFSLVDSPLVVVCRTDHSFGRRRTMALAALADYEQAGFPPGWGVRTLADSALRAAGVAPQVNLEVNDTNTLLDLVEAGLGVALIPEAIAQSRPNLHQVTITDGTWNWTIAALAVAPMPVNPAARALWEMLTTHRASSPSSEH